MSRSLILMRVGAAKMVPLRGTQVRIGRAPDNELVVDDCQISRWHASIYLGGSTVLITDRHSCNGLYVNGRKVALAALRHGDTIRVGRTAMRYHDAQSGGRR